MRVFPIYQTYGGEATYFTRYQGQKDAEEAKTAAQEFGFPPSVTIYFAVDYDALMIDITTNIIPYFQGINEIMKGSFQVGAYGPRAVCNRLSTYGLIEKSFVADMSSGFTGNIGQIMPANWAYDQFYETNEAGIGIDKNIASPRATAISPANFVSYEIPEEPEITQSFEVFKRIYDLAYEYLENLSTPTTGVYPSVLNANIVALQYLRTAAYTNSGDGISLSGVAWDIIAGARDEAFIELAEQTYDDIIPENIVITDPLTGTDIAFPHYAATLNACISGTFGYNFEFLEKNVDSFAGWAGDLMQMAGILQISADMGYDYFNSQDLKAMIGAAPLSLQNYHLFTRNESGDAVEMDIKDAGFSREDLYQDVEKLLEQYEVNNLYAVAERFTKEELGLLSMVFEEAFGNFNGPQYGEILALAFEEEMDSLAEAM